jgi:TRAP-type uncharacterized transport system fused permease subunit
MKADLQGLPKAHSRTRLQGLVGFAMTAAGFVILAAAVYYGIGWTRDVFGPAATWAIGAVIIAVYVALIAFRARHPDLALDDPNAPLLVLPQTGAVARTGLHFLLPVVVLVWCLMVERLSPGLSAFYGTMFLVAILVTQRPLTAFFRGRRDLMGPLLAGFRDLFDALVAGARNMVGIGVATAVGLVMTEIVGFLSAGNLILMLLLTAVICLILGMGLPTTANYIVVATLMAPVITELAAQQGLAVPLIAVHLFVFYFGLMADVTPPVGLAAFAASAISGADPIRTGVQAFRYEIRTGLLPFIFIFNHQLILVGADDALTIAITAAAGLLAMLAFVGATQGWFVARSRWYESVALLVACFTLFRPGFWLDLIEPPFEPRPAAQIYALAEAQPPGGTLVVAASGETLAGRAVSKSVRLPLGPAGAGEERLKQAGLELIVDGDTVTVDFVDFGSPAEKLGLDLDWVIDEVQLPAQRPRKEWFFVPALLLVGGVFLLQRRRAPRKLVERAA